MRCPLTRKSTFSGAVLPKAARIRTRTGPIGISSFCRPGTLEVKRRLFKCRTRRFLSLSWPTSNGVKLKKISLSSRLSQSSANLTRCMMIFHSSRLLAAVDRLQADISPNVRKHPSHKPSSALTRQTEMQGVGMSSPANETEFARAVKLCMASCLDNMLR